MIATEEDVADALAALALAHPALAPIIAAAGTVPLRPAPGGLRGLVGVVLAQQVSKASASAMLRRLEEIVDCSDPKALATATPEMFRAAGLSRAKAATLSALSAACADGLDLHALSRSDPADAIRFLTALPGIGPWTAECFLLFSAGHPDIFPSGDLALQVAVGRAFGLPQRPTARETAGIAAAWAPHRSVAARLFWAYYAALTGRDAAPAPELPANPVPDVRS